MALPQKHVGLVLLGSWPNIRKIISHPQARFAHSHHSSFLFFTGVDLRSLPGDAESPFRCASQESTRLVNACLLGVPRNLALTIWSFWVFSEVKKSPRLLLQPLPAVGFLRAATSCPTTKCGNDWRIHRMAILCGLFKIWRGPRCSIRPRKFAGIRLDRRLTSSPPRSSWN